MGVRAEQDDAYLGLWRFRVLPVLGLVLSSGLEHLKKTVTHHDCQQCMQYAHAEPELVSTVADCLLVQV